MDVEAAGRHRASVPPAPPPETPNWILGEPGMVPEILRTGRLTEGPDPATATRPLSHTATKRDVQTKA